MNMHAIYLYLTAFMLVTAIATFIATMIKVTPYGRHMAPNQPRTVPALRAWLIFAAPEWFAFALTFWLTARVRSDTAVILFLLWQAHYIYRAIIYPLHMRDRNKRFPLSGVIFGFLFNCINGFINGYAVSHAAYLNNAWLLDPRFIAGLAIALTGWWINFKSDSILIDLRKEGETGYKVPHGGMFKYVSAANYFGEIILWSGWALMTCTTAGIVFAIFTFANLFPRALSHHKWYLATFPDYPKDRKAIIPHLL